MMEKKSVAIKQVWNSCRHSDSRPRHQVRVDVVFRIQRAHLVTFEIHESYFDEIVGKWAIEFPMFVPDQVHAVAWAERSDSDAIHIANELM